jgi:quercetin dioxygenase-like cupin family protein
VELYQALQDAPLETIAPGVRRFIFALDKVMLAYFELAPGARVAEHAHPHEQMGILLKGRSRWRMRGEERLLEAPALYRVPSGEPHEVEVVGDEPVHVMDVFSPIREDFLGGAPPAYMKK